MTTELPTRTVIDILEVPRNARSAELEVFNPVYVLAIEERLRAAAALLADSAKIQDQIYGYEVDWHDRVKALMEKLRAEGLVP